MALPCKGGAFVYINCFFVTIATILGTGILALPVGLADSGFFPFFCVFSLSYFMQVSAVYLMIELIQRAHLRLAGADAFSTELSTLSTGGGGGAADNEATNGHGGGAPPPQSSHGAASIAPDLHTMGHLFLGPDARAEEDAAGGGVAGGGQRGGGGVLAWLRPGRGMQVVFDVCVMLHFVSIMISYSLAGPEAYAQLLGVGNFKYLIVPFVAGYTALVLGCGAKLQAGISTLTLAKCVLLVAMVGAIGYVGGRQGISPRSSFGAVGEPFLLGTVALGGVVNILPILYPTVPHTARGLTLFRRSVCAGVAVCWLLNVLWCWYVLKAVPQYPADGPTAAEAAAAEAKGQDPFARECKAAAEEAGGGAVPYGLISLAGARKCGEISTVPVVEVIDAKYAAQAWLGKAVSVFIGISITVSFMTIGIATKHVLDGIVNQFLHPARHRRRSAARRAALGRHGSQESMLRRGENGLVARTTSGAASVVDAGAGGGTAAAAGGGGTAAGAARRQPVHASELRARLAHWAAHWRQRPKGFQRLVYGSTFGLILLVALVDPKGFLHIIEFLTSLALNFEAGVFIAIMFLVARRPAARSRERTRRLQELALQRRADAPPATPTKAGDGSSSSTAGGGSAHVDIGGGPAAEENQIPMPLTGWRARAALGTCMGMYTFAVFYALASGGIKFLGAGGFWALLVCLALAAAGYCYYRRVRRKRRAEEQQALDLTFELSPGGTDDFPRRKRRSSGSRDYRNLVSSDSPQQQASQQHSRDAEPSSPQWRNISLSDDTDDIDAFGHGPVEAIATI